MTWFAFTWQNFWFSFLALIFEGIPFVLLGSLISGVIAAFIPSRVITGLLPKNRLVANLISGLLGIIFPVCECGIVPIVRRLLHKGLPLSCGVTYMLASPIVNPIVIFSTSEARQDIVHSYELGANCYVSKPGNLQGFISAVTCIGEFWSGVARLPCGEE